MLLQGGGGGRGGESTGRKKGVSLSFWKSFFGGYGNCESEATTLRLAGLSSVDALAFVISRIYG